MQSMLTKNYRKVEPGPRNIYMVVINPFQAHNQAQDHACGATNDTKPSSS
jgi:hypothetical protein